MKQLFRNLMRRVGYVPAQGFVKRSFSAAQTTRLTADWSINALSPDSLLRQDLAVIRTRARDLGINDPYFQKFLTMLKSNVLGAEGITLKNKACDPVGFKNGQVIPGQPDILANKLIEDAWWDWCKKENCTVAKDMTFQECSALSIETIGTDGETLWRIVTGKDAGNKYGFAIQPIETERIDTSRNSLMENGNTVRMGIERDTMGRKVSIWIFDSDPSDSFPSRGTRQSKPYPASDFIHPYMVRRIGQTRGFPWAAVSMMRAKMLGGYEEAHLEGTRGAACKMGLLKHKGDAPYPGEDAAGGGKYMDAEPGSIEMLPEGLEFQALDWGYPHTNYGDYVKACLRGISAGLNVSYNTLANDLEGVNFSSGRLGLMEEREFWKFVQNWFALNFNTPIFSRWLEASLLSGAIALELPSGDRRPLPASKFAKFNQPVWRGRRWQWVDPTKEVEAKKNEIRCAFTSPVRVIAEMGEDVDEVLSEIKEFKDKAAAMGLDFPDLFAAQNVPQQPNDTAAPNEPMVKA